MGVKISKTEQLIYDSFYKLRKNNPINKIKVTDVCDGANVNRSTFYEYFNDVYDLTSKLERLMIIDSFKDFDKQEIIYCKPYEFLTDFNNRLNKYMKELTLLGKGRERELMFNIEDEIDNLFESDNDKKNLISFIIGGSIHVLEKNKLFDKDYDYENVNKQLEELSKSILSLYNKD